MSITCGSHTERPQTLCRWTRYLCVLSARILEEAERAACSERGDRAEHRLERRDAEREEDEVSRHRSQAWVCAKQSRSRTRDRDTVALALSQRCPENLRGTSHLSQTWRSPLSQTWHHSLEFEF